VREEAARAGLKRRNARHVRLVKLEVEDVEVLSYPFLAHRLGQRHDTALNELAQHDLSYRFAVRVADCHENLVVEEIVTALSERLVDQVAPFRSAIWKTPKPTTGIWMPFFEVT